MFCTNCGNKIDDGVAFCTVCGAKVEAAFTDAAKENANALNNAMTDTVNESTDAAASGAAEAAQTAMNTANEEMTNAVNGVANMPTQQLQPQTQQAQPQMQQPQFGQQGQPQQQFAQQPQPQKPKKKAWIPIVIAAGVVLIAGIITLSVLALRSFKNIAGKSEDVVTESAEEDSSDKRGRKARDKDKDSEDASSDTDTDEALDEFDEYGFDYDDDYSDYYITELNPASDETLDILKNIDTDYANVNWTRFYELDEMDGVAISTAIFELEDADWLAVAITNLYSDDIEIYGDVYALDKNGEEIGSEYIDWSALANCGTAVGVIYCDEGVPTGEVSVELYVASSDGYEGYWEADWSVSGDSDYGYLTSEYTLYNPSDNLYEATYMDVFLVDDKGNITGYGYDYLSRALNPGESLDGDIEIYGDTAGLDKAAGAAMFVQTLVISDDALFFDDDGTAYFESENGDSVFLLDNGDGTCGVYLVVHTGDWVVAYTDIDADLYLADGYVEFKDIDTGEYVGLIYISGDDAYVYMYNTGVEYIEDGTTIELIKYRISASDKAEFTKNIESRR